MGNIINQETLPDKYPTSYHDADFWESLGRAVATFGFLEQVLGKAIFAFTATRPYEETEIEQALGEWVPKLERALSDPLVNLINARSDELQKDSLKKSLAPLKRARLSINIK